jgi:hypothetical protein
MGPIRQFTDRLLCGGMLLFMAIAAQAADQGVTPTPCSAGVSLPGSEISARLMSRNADRAHKLGQVESTRLYDLEYAGFPSGLSAHMQVKVLYTAQGTKKFTLVSESARGYSAITFCISYWTRRRKRLRTKPTATRWR